MSIRIPKKLEVAQIYHSESDRREALEAKAINKYFVKMESAPNQKHFPVQWAAYRNCMMAAYILDIDKIYN
jgi:pantothenate kinase